MQKRQQRSLKRSTEEIWKISGGKKEKNCQKDLQQKSYIGRQIKGMMRNIGQSQRETGDIGKEAELEGKEQ